MKISQAPSEQRPEWLHPTPNWTAALSGVLYQGVPTDVLLSYLRDSSIVAVWASVGRCLYHRSEGPRMSYNTERLDRSRGVRVKDREWPWCHGDELVFLTYGPAGVTIFDIELDHPQDGRWYSEVGTTPEGASCYAFMAKAEAWVDEIIGPRARLLDVKQLQQEASDLRHPGPIARSPTMVTPKTRT